MLHTIEKKLEEASDKIRETVSGSSVEPNTLTRMNGCPIAHYKVSMTAGPHGPVLMQDVTLLEKLTQFTREKIPARNVHALGCGAYGTFTVTNDITKYTSAKLFSQVGKKTELFSRFSGIFTEQGEADTTRDPRGFAIKFYTEEGNWDLMGIDTPVFNIRDAKLGPDAVHAFKRDPRTGMWNADQLWDFVANNPEGLHQVLMVFSDRSGTPFSYRTMNAYGCHTFSVVNDKNERFWIKYHILSEQGAKGFNNVQAKLVAGEDPNFLSRDLFNAIERGDYPKWKLMCQIMPEEEGYQHVWTFDPTKVWKHKDYPLIEIGTIEINKNPTDYFTEVEQVAFAPTNFVPGMGLSPDRLLQGRLLIYDDTQHHRIGPNFKQLYINKPRYETHNMHTLGGNMNLEVKNKFPHYLGNSFGGYKPNLKYNEPAYRVDGPAGFYQWIDEGSDFDYYGQCRDFWSILNDVDKNNLCDNIAASLFKISEQTIADKMLMHLNKVNTTMGTTIQKMLNDRNSGNYKKTDAEMLVADSITYLATKKVHA